MTLSPISGSQPGNTQHEEQLHEFCHSCCSDILGFGKVGGRETFYLHEEQETEMQSDSRNLHLQKTHSL